MVNEPTVLETRRKGHGKDSRIDLATSLTSITSVVLARYRTNKARGKRMLITCVGHSISNPSRIRACPRFDHQVGRY